MEQDSSVIEIYDGNLLVVKELVQDDLYETRIKAGNKTCFLLFGHLVFPVARLPGCPRMSSLRGTQ